MPENHFDSNNYVENQDESEIVVPERFSHIFFRKERFVDSLEEFAGMALPTQMQYDLSQESGLLTVDNGATSTLSNSLFNMKSVQQCSVPISLAGRGMSIKATHSGFKTYYIKDITGAVHPCTTKSYYVPDLEQDLLAGRSLINAKYRVILDKDPKISGIFPVTNGEIDPSTGIPFVDSEGLFFVETVPISETQFKSISGYASWHRRLGHAPMATIRDTIPHAIGLEALKNTTFNPEEYCPACMLGKSHLEIRPRSREHAIRPLERVYMDIITSSVVSMEGFKYALVIVDDASMYRWVYGLTDKSKANDAARKWICDIADLRARHVLQILIRDNAGELKSQDLLDYIESLGVKDYFSVAYEQYQNGPAESSINSCMLLTRTQLAESGLGGKYWFRSLVSAKDARNATYHARIKTTPHYFIFGKPKNVSKFRAFGCRAYPYLNEDWRENGKHVLRAAEGINLGFDTNSSGYVIHVPSTGKTYVTNNVRFDEYHFPYRKKEVIDQHVKSELERLLRVDSPITWEPYSVDRREVYEKVFHDPTSDDLVMRVTDKKDTFVRIPQMQYLSDILHTQRAMVAKIAEENAKADEKSPVIDYNRPPKNYKDAMSRPDAPEWMEAYMNEYQGFKNRDVVKIVVPPPGAKILGSTTRAEYKTDQGVLQKRKIRLCARGDQQVYEVNDTYSPVLKAPEVRLLTAIAAQHGCNIYKTDTKQAFLYGDLDEDEPIYIRAPDWWFEPVQEGSMLQLMKAVYGTVQAARRWHTKISTWMENNDYAPVNSEKTIFMKRVGEDFIIHGIFVDDMKHVPTAKYLLDEFLEKYTRDFEITGGHQLMESFIGLEVEQSDSKISLHLDSYIQETIGVYKEYVKKMLRPKLTPMQPGNILKPDDAPTTPDKKRQTFYRSMVARLQFAATWVRFDISYTVGQLARFCASAGPSHCAALHHLMEYIVKYPSFKLDYKKKPNKVTGLDGFCDADWGTSDTRRSTTGNVFRYNGAPIHWKSKLQKTIALSTAEAEYYLASLGAVEVIYLRTLLRDMGFAPKSPTPVYEDNTACIEWTNNVIGGRERAKHIDIRKHFAHEAVQLGHLRLIRVATTDQLADVFTKSLQPRLHAACIGGILGRPWTIS